MLLESNVKRSGFYSCKAAGEKMDVNTLMGDFPSERERPICHSMLQTYYVDVIKRTGPVISIVYYALL